MAKVKRTLKQKVTNVLFFASASVFVGGIIFVVLFIFGLILHIVDNLTSTL